MSINFSTYYFMNSVSQLLTSHQTLETSRQKKCEIIGNSISSQWIKNSIFTIVRKTIVTTLTKKKTKYQEENKTNYRTEIKHNTTKKKHRNNNKKLNLIQFLF